MNPYYTLGVDENAEISVLKDKLKEWGKVSQKDIDLLLEGKSETEQKEILLDEVIRVNYEYLNAKAKRDIAMYPALDKFKEMQKKYHQAYEMINTKEKRDEYERTREKEIPKRNAKTRKIIPITPKKEKPQSQIRAILEKGIKINTSLSEDEILYADKRKWDPHNRFPKFSGVQFKWGIRMDNEKLLSNACLVNEINEKGEQVFATILGTLQYERLIGRPTEEKPEGIYGKGVSEGARVVGVTKSNAEGEVLKNEICYLKSDLSASEEFIKFLTDIVLSDEIINCAKQENQGFIGSIVRQENTRFEKYKIASNDFGDSSVVNVLKVANNKEGKLYVTKEGKIWKESENTLPEVEEKLKKFQLNFRKAFLQPVPKNPPEKPIQNFQGKKGEEDVWAK